MCRLLVQTGYDGSPEMYKRFEEALALMKNGGPDNTTIIERDGILFGHNRLSIIDLSDEANQPFETEKYIVLFNGEIYNYEKARITSGLNCDTESDTEVIVRMFESRGINFVKYLYGEYAIVIYDKDTKELLQVTDPSGIKPLFFTINDDPVIISSEQKAIKHLIQDRAIFNGNLDSFLQFGYFDETPFTEIARAQKGRMSSFDPYRGYSENYIMDVPTPTLRTIGEKIKPSLIRHMIENSVKERMRADVPIACALSGGIDSAILAYCMKKNSPFRIKTYTVGFKGLDNEFDEAQQMAKWLGSDHYEIEIDPKEILENIDDIIETMEEPVDRGSLIPTYFLAKNVKEKVILVGEGADEIFGGYKRHQNYMQALTLGERIDYDEFTEKYYNMFDLSELKEGEHQYEVVDLSPMKFDLNNEIPYFHCQRLDRCFMRFGIEARVPYLDPMLIAMASYIPFSKNIIPEKKILRDAFRGKIPDWVIDRKKRPLKLPFEYMIEMEEVKRNIHDYDNPWIKKEAIMQIYESSPDSRNRGRKLWAIYLMNKWHQKNQR